MSMREVRERLTREGLSIEPRISAEQIMFELLVEFEYWRAIDTDFSMGAFGAVSNVIGRATVPLHKFLTDESPHEQHAAPTRINPLAEVQFLKAKQRAGHQEEVGEVCRLDCTGCLDPVGQIINQLETTEALALHLANAIRKHRDYRGDDRCWMDDEELYRALPEGYNPPPRDTSVELPYCERFIRNRHNPATKYVSPQRRIELLERVNLAADKVYVNRHQMFDGPESDPMVLFRAIKSMGSQLNVAAGFLPDDERYQPIPISMVLHCPECGTQHIDAEESEADFHNRMRAWLLIAEPQDKVPTRWTNPPHRSHQCHACPCVWRPADVATTGVAAIQTRGKVDNWPTVGER